MQTFLTRMEDYALSAADLDSVRLNKQISETKQIINAIQGGESAAWSRHPVVDMWFDYVPALQAYGQACLEEWRSRGGKGHATHNFGTHTRWQYPWWSDCDAVYQSHRSRLNHKGMVDALRSALPRGHWPTFRALYCTRLPKTWNQFKPRDRYELENILHKLNMSPTIDPHYKFRCCSDYMYIWPCREHGKFKVLINEVWTEWAVGCPLVEYPWGPDEW